MSVLFAGKAMLRRKTTLLNAGLAAAAGLSAGVLLPLVVTEFVNGLASGERHALWSLFANLAVVAALSAATEFMQWRVETNTSIVLRLTTILRFTDKLRGNAHAAPGGFEFGQAVQAATTKAKLIGGYIPSLALSVGGFLTLLILQRMPWWVYVAFVAIVLASAGIYWRLKDTTPWREAGIVEGESVAALTVLAQEPNRQVRPALLRAVRGAAINASRKRSDAHRRITQPAVLARAVLGGLLLVLAGLSAIVGKAEPGALFLVFALTFKGHILQMQYILEAFRNVVTDSVGVADVLDAPVWPELQPQPLAAALLARHMKVTYVQKDGLEKVVNIPDLVVLKGAVKILDGPNGCGKTTFIKAVSGDLPNGYDGSLKICGIEAAGKDTSSVVVVLRQHHLKYPVTLEDLFADEKGYVYTGLRQQALTWAMVDFPLSMLHSELSDGQRQKANLALCFYEVMRRRSEVRIVLLDEPTNHLDVSSQSVIADNILEFVQMFSHVGGASVVATHARDLQRVLKKVV